MGKYVIPSVLDWVSGGAADFSQLNPAHFVEQDTSITEKDGVETVYQYAFGDVLDAPSLRIGVYPNPKANMGRGQTNTSVKLTIPVQLQDEETDAVMLRDPATFTLAWSLPGTAATYDHPIMLALIFTLVSTVCPVSSAQAAVTRLAALAFKISRILGIAWADPTP